MLLRSLTVLFFVAGYPRGSLYASATRTHNLPQTQRLDGIQIRKSPRGFMWTSNSQPLIRTAREVVNNVNENKIGWNEERYHFPVDIETQKRKLDTKNSFNQANSIPDIDSSLLKRYDRFLQSEDLAREHAKLVLDINNLSYSANSLNGDPQEEKTDESIYTENIEGLTGNAPENTFSSTAFPTSTSASTVQPVQSSSFLPVSTPLTRTTTRSMFTTFRTAQTLKPIVFRSMSSTLKPVRSVPLILIGGNSVKMSMKPAATVQTAMKHPYPFVPLMASASTTKPMKLCNQHGLPMMYPTRAPTLWERLVSIFPRLLRVGRHVLGLPTTRQDNNFASRFP